MGGCSKGPACGCTTSVPTRSSLPPTSQRRRASSCRLAEIHQKLPDPRRVGLNIFRPRHFFFAPEHVFQRLLPKNLELWRATREEGGRICAMLFTGPRVKKEVRESVHHEGARGSAARCSLPSLDRVVTSNNLRVPVCGTVFSKYLFSDFAEVLRAVRRKKGQISASFLEPSGCNLDLK